MLRSIKEIYGYKLRATDGEIGKVREFYFADDTWEVRYLVADTGGWLTGREVLIAPDALAQPDWVKQAFPVNLTKKQIEESPPLATDQPVSRAEEAKLRTYFGWPVNPGGGLFTAGGGYGMYPVPLRTAAVETPEKEPPKQTDDDPHLRSTKEVTGYHIHAIDGAIGHVEDFIADDEQWVIRYLVVDTRNWLPGRKVLISPGWIKHVNWPESAVTVNLTRAEVKDSPKYDPAQPVNRDYEGLLHDYYGRPKYWQGA